MAAMQHGAALPAHAVLMPSAAIVRRADSAGGTMSHTPDPDILAVLDPAKSAVVEACAGSGKTWLLAARIVRLLLAGAKPGEILAITFTRKAAREIEERVVEGCAAWPGRRPGCRRLPAGTGVPETSIDASAIARAEGSTNC